MKGFAIKSSGVSITLTSEQVREAYRQLVKAEGEDWLYEPEVVEEIHRRAHLAQKELKARHTVTWKPRRKKSVAS